MAYKGIAMLLHALPRLTPETALQLKGAAIRVLKTFWPVTVNWNLYDSDRQWTGGEQSLVSQRYAEEKFGVPPP